MLIVTDRGSLATGVHVGSIAGDVVEHDGRLVEVAGPLADELRAALAAGGGDLRDVEHGGPACVPSIRDAVILRWVHDRAANRPVIVAAVHDLELKSTARPQLAIVGCDAGTELPRVITCGRSSRGRRRPGQQVRGVAGRR